MRSLRRWIASKAFWDDVIVWLYSGVRKAGLLTVAAGAALIAWAFAAHYQAALRGWTLESWPHTRVLLGGARIA